MIYINRFIDNEEDTTRYEQFIVTDENCEALIKECVRVYYALIDYENVKEYLDNVISIDSRIKNTLDNEIYHNYDHYDFENAYLFTTTILEDNNLLVIDYETQKYYY